MRAKIPFRVVILFSLISRSWSAGIIHAQDRWTKANADIVRLSPRLFPKLPKGVVPKLLSMRCTIPQAKEISTRHNVIKGHFKRPKQTDWAVLCSRHRVSAVVIFWGGSANSISQIARASDEGFLQTIDGDGTIGFSRRIATVNRGYILEHYRNYHGPKPPPIDHQGIDDAYLEKASTIHYHFRRKWRELRGAD